MECCSVGVESMSRRKMVRVITAHEMEGQDTCGRNRLPASETPARLEQVVLTVGYSCGFALAADPYTLAGAGVSQGSLLPNIR